MDAKGDYGRSEQSGIVGWPSSPSKQILHLEKSASEKRDSNYLSGKFSSPSLTQQKLDLLLIQQHHAQPSLTHERRVGKNLLRFDLRQ